MFILPIVAFTEQYASVFYGLENHVELQQLVHKVSMWFVHVTNQFPGAQDQEV
jgi:hypothetical protein